MNYNRIPIVFDTTLEILIGTSNSLFSDVYGKELQFLEYEVDGKTNYDLILEKYSKRDLQTEAVRVQSRLLSLIKAGTELYLPKSLLDLDLVPLIGRNQFIKNTTTFTSFYGLYLDLLRKDGFKPIFRESNTLSDIDIREYSVSLWVWSRAYSRNGSVLLDLTSFIESLSTSVDGTQNNFSISLQPSDKNYIDVGDELLSRIDIDGKFTEKLPVSWLFNILQQNDIVFIRFERLELEKVEDRVRSGLEIPSSSLPGKTFDMIGLVENISNSYSAETNDLSLSVSGGDLTRLLIEDGAYFFPLLFTENADTLFFNTQDDSKWYKRNFTSGVFENFFTYQLQSIKDSLGFIVNQLSNLGVCNDELFKSYDETKEGLGGRRARSMRLVGDSKTQTEWNVVSGVWQIVDLLVDPQITDRRVANSQIANPSGNLLGVVDSICQSPFVEFFGDTYGDKFTFVARQSPFTKNAITSIFNSGNFISINSRDVDSFDLQWEQTFYTWFQMDPRNMFLGKSDSVALAYLPVIYFPEIAESFGNKQFTLTNNYISNSALSGQKDSINTDQFKSKIIEDFLYVLESFCYLPFTQKGTIILKRDRRIKARTWVRLGDQIFYVNSVSNSFTAVGEKIAGNTILNVSRGMFYNYVEGVFVEELGKQVDYWSMIRLEAIRKTLIQTLMVEQTQGDVEVKIPKNTVKMSFGTNKDVFDFFLQRRFL